MNNAPNLALHQARSTEREFIPDRNHGTNVANIQRTWHIAARYKWLILGMALAGGVAGYFKANSAIPIYQAQLALLIEPEEFSSGRSVENIPLGYVNPFKNYKTQTEIITSWTIAERVAEQLDPQNYSWLFENNQPAKPRKFWVYINSLVGKQVAPIDHVTPPANLDRAVLKQRLVDLVKATLSAKGEDYNHIMKISGRSPYPEFAADVVNAAADAYVKLSHDTRLSAVKFANTWITQQMEDLRQKVATGEARLQAYQASEKMVDTENSQGLLTSRLSALNEAYTVEQNKVSALANRYGPKHPSLIAAKEAVRELEKRLQAEKKNVVGSQEKNFELAKLERDVVTFTQLYDRFLKRLEETDLAMSYKANDVRVIDYARVPQRPIAPNKQRILTTWIFGGLMLGILFAWLRETLDNTFKSPDDIEQQTAIPVLGVVPFIGGATKRKSDRLKELSPERHYLGGAKSVFSESINHIRLGLKYSDVDNPPRIIMVTSAIPGEGKTTLCTNLALSYSRLGRTLLLDADLRKPTVAEISGLKHFDGLTDVVAGTLGLDDAIVIDRDSENLFIIKSGTNPPNPMELLSSNKFERLLAEVRKDFDYVLVDSPPVLPVSDALILGQLVDSVVLVVRAEKTNRSATISALKNLSKAHIKVSGAVLSQVVGKKMAYYYPDNYCGYYDKYYGTAEAGISAQSDPASTYGPRVSGDHVKRSA